ncbi:hypothetical protein CASFOL_019398 [Castilleja foliolosa]|uniref:Uncharacterized protein n=1 Tax=Castilleja foliolosa TaxID=1961234 RepID=A0ABD3D725_9LAMI
MDEQKIKSSEMRVSGGVNLPGLSYNYNQENKGFAAMTSNNNYNNDNYNYNTSMWQNQQSDKQRMETNMSYMASNFCQPQSFQNQFVEQVPERQHIYQFPMQFNPYPSTLRQHLQVQQFILDLFLK